MEETHRFQYALSYPYAVWKGGDEAGFDLPQHLPPRVRCGLINYNAPKYPKLVPPVVPRHTETQRGGRGGRGGFSPLQVN